MMAVWRQFVLLIILFGGLSASDDLSEEIGWGDYGQGATVVGNVAIAGSDTLTNVISAWANVFQRFHPGVNIGVEGRGSSTVPPALLERTIDIGVMSRRRSSRELAEHRQRHGSIPLEITIALDAVVVYVNRNNPLEQITLRQLRELFIEERSADMSYRTWSDLGLEGDFGKFSLSRYGRNAASGTYAFFKNRVLLADDFNRRVEEFPGSSALVRAIGADRYAVGYSGIGYKTSDVKVLPISRDAVRYFYPTFESCVSGEYPLARELFFYIPAAKSGSQSEAVSEFVRFVLSAQGQGMLLEAGFFPISGDGLLDELSSKLPEVFDAP